ncbi:FadR family transcriptional regulator [Amycolatopsis acidiphila]|uniref:FadR family transcriptional regulator n=1 Tax=Amycolatopsis acidiphila TaxID=715473 RepID=A0A558AL60_9PSEU|nr:FadR/GntR family transcriptional regulator [Amycolatopsis acidiphila]TVT24993.1 FadR family transcriptional regulator [Amycolatopsis acidiphila]UIJ57500.1 FadR family transcriptional regulator [Amycolatopsis acidiphila]
MADGNTSRIQPVRRLKVSDSVAAQLEQLIEQGDYQPGDKLPPERALAEQFGVGRSSMREALRLVEANGLLRTEHGIGVFVVSNTKRAPILSELLLFDDFTVPELFEARLSLERDAAGAAAKRITADEAEELRRILDEAGNPALSNDAFVKLDADLHRAIVKATKNRIWQRVYESIEPLFITYSHRVIQLPGRRETAHNSHRRIVAAILSRSVREARSAAVTHIREVEREIVKHLDPAEQVDKTVR